MRPMDSGNWYKRTIKTVGTSLLLLSGISFLASEELRAQTTDVIGGNSIPASRPKLVINGGTEENVRSDRNSVSKVEITSGTSAKLSRSSLGAAGKGLDTIRTASSDPTAIYRIGVNDLLSIAIADVPAPPKVVKVRADGTIDFPLAGTEIAVAGKTPREAASTIAGALRLVLDPRVTVRVCDYSSHSVNVWGLVDNPGEQQIQRDAVPFFVIRAGITIDTRARKVRITSSTTGITVEFEISDARLADHLVYPGDSIEFGAL